MMRIFIFSLFIFLTFQAGLSAQSKTVRQLETLERQRFEAMTKKDISFLKEVLAEELTYTHSNGLVETKTAHLENIQNGSLVYQSMQSETMEVRVFKKSAVITGTVKVSGILRGKAFDIRLRYLDVYIKRKGKWQLAGWQSAKIEG